ncbi:MAG TPA: EF-hand domain-containing protein [Allosphingosinicella sp.]|nr:EF-hand domain-containing protein [Allosphingosinicella sp.]
MKRMVFAGAALAALAAVPVLAQPGVEDRRGPAQPLTRAAVEDRVEARFARADTNRDGFVTRDEVRARAEARRAERRQRRAERREQRFEALDANHDGSISRAEFTDRPALRGGERGERRAIRGERRGQRFGRRGGGFMMVRFGARAFAAMDLDRDGRVALAEAERAALERFDRIDADRDGTISLDERRAAREAFRGRLREGRED